MAVSMWVGRRRTRDAVRKHAPSDAGNPSLAALSERLRRECAHVCPQVLHYGVALAHTITRGLVAAPWPGRTGLPLWALSAASYANGKRDHNGNTFHAHATPLHSGAP